MTAALVRGPFGPRLRSQGRSGVGGPDGALALSIGTGLEGATHSGVRKALDAGCDPEEIRHVAVLGVTTLGFPTMMRARVWVEDVLQ